MTDHAAPAADPGPEPTAQPETATAESHPEEDRAPSAEPRRRRRWVRVLRWGVAGVLVLVVIVALGGVWAVRDAFPDYGGRVHIPGLAGTVTVYRDANAIPQVYAGTADDLFTAQGYVHAQERFWEMDFRRHITSGRLAEMFGESQVDSDTYLRTMGWRHVAEQEWNLIDAQTRRYLRDYANGVNAYLGTHGASAISLEYSVLKLSNGGYHIEKWDPVDSLAWLKAMAWDLWGNFDDESTRAALLAAGLTRAQVEQLYPAYPTDTHRPIVEGGTVSNGVFQAGTPSTTMDGVSTETLRAAAPAIGAARDAMTRLDSVAGGYFPGVGSNNWVISGSLTTTGKPILANDPHLAPSMPGIWYQMGLHCTCEFNVEGFTFSGVPGVVIGHNGNVAWGFTNLNPDVTDLYLEQVRGDTYLVDGQWRPLATRQETIRVAGGKPVTITVRTTNNGPLLSDASDELRTIGGKPPIDATGAARDTAGSEKYAVALRWTALDPGHTMDALFALDRATDWSSFRAAAARFEVPAQNMVYADTRGNIGYQAPGRIPVRGMGDGRWPAPGWDSRYDWTSYIPFDALPNVLNPARGYLASANNEVVDPRGYPYLLTDDWSYGYRSQRIADMIDQATANGRKVSVADVQGMQFDSRNTFASQIVPRLLSVPVSPGTTKALDLLRGWDFQQPADGASGTAAARGSAAAAFFNAFYRQLLSRTFDELPTDHKPDGDDRWWVVLLGLLDQPDSPWWDDRSTPRVEHRDDILRAALDGAATELRGRLGGDPTSWRWGSLHTLTLRSQTFGSSGIAPLEWAFNYGPTGVSGGSSIVDATGWDPAKGYEVTAVPSMRMIVDLSNLDSSRWVSLTGESGHAFSAHYRDQFDLWRTGRTLPMRWDEASVRRESKATQVLYP